LRIGSDQLLLILLLVLTLLLSLLALLLPLLPLLHLALSTAGSSECRLAENLAVWWAFCF